LRESSLYWAKRKLDGHSDFEELKQEAVNLLRGFYLHQEVGRFFASFQEEIMVRLDAIKLI